MAVMVLSVGLLALAGGMGVVVGSVTRSEVVTDRTVALQTGLETVRSTDYEELESGSKESGPYEISWETVDEGANWKDVEVVISGPGPSGPGSGMRGVAGEVTDTFTYTVMQP